MTTTFSTFAPSDIQFETPVIRMALRRNNIAIWEYCFKNQKVKFNKVLFRVLGFSPNVFLPTLNSYKALVHPDDLKGIEQTVSDCLSLTNKKTVDIQFRIKTRSGTWKWINNKSSIERDENGMPVKCIGTIMDITKLKEAENLANEKNRHLNELVDSLTDYIIEIDSTYNIVDTWAHKKNEHRKQLRSFHGLKVGDVFGRRLTETCEKLIDDTILSGLSQQMEYKAKRFDKCYSVKTSLVLNGLNGYKTVSVIIQDITKRKQARFKLERNEANLTAMIQNTSDVFWTLDRDNKLILCNKAFRDLHLRVNNKAPIIGEPLCVGMLLKESVNKCVEIHKRSLKGLSTTLTRPVHFNDSEDKLYYEFRVNPLKDDNGEVIGSVVSGRDINEIYEAKLEAEAATALKSKFVSTISHELRTPLNAILGMSNHLAKFNTQENLSEDIEILKQASDNLLALITDVLDFSKLESDKAVITKNEFDLRGYIDEVVKLNSPSLVEKNLLLNVEISENLPKTVSFDKSKLNQILSNLFSNAIKFTESGSITLKVLQLNQNQGVSRIQISIEDTGIGIPEMELTSVFESFAQSSSSSQRLIGGTGLGLAITKKLVNLLNGKIDVKSKLGKGTIFTVELDFEVTLKKMETIKKVNNKEMDLSGINVLVAEDNLINAKIITRLLGQWNATFDLAENGAEAVKFAKDNVYNVILMDIQMPVKNGFEASEEIHSSGLNQLTPILALTAQPDFSYDADYEEGMFAGHILKPFHPDSLKQCVFEHSRPNKFDNLDMVG